MYTLQVYGACDREVLEMVSNYMFDTAEEAIAIKAVIQRAFKSVTVSVQG